MGVAPGFMQLSELEKYTGQLLQCDRFRDYAPNGVQVEGRAEIQHIVCGVTASLDLIDAAIALDADAILVHHGYFWRGEDARVIGSKKQRLARLLRHDLSLFAYHLPLDAHPELGNNAQLGLRLGLTIDKYFGEQSLGVSGTLAQATPLAEFGRLVATTLGREPLLIGAPDAVVQRLGWCSGGAQSYLLDAKAAGCDAYLTGEVSERNYYEAREAGIAFIAAGHHATERYGVQALAQHWLAQFGITWQFIEANNPI